MALVVIIDDGEKKHRITVTNKPFVVGRSSKCHLKINDDLISGKHVSVRVKDRRVFVQDMNSTNGTYFNGHKLQHNFLMIGDQFLFGNCRGKIDASKMDKAEKKLHVRTSSAGQTTIQTMALPEDQDDNSASIVKEANIESSPEVEQAESKEVEEEKAPKISIDFSETDNKPTESEREDEHENIKEISASPALSDDPDSKSDDFEINHTQHTSQSHLNFSEKNSDQEADSKQSHFKEVAENLKEKEKKQKPNYNKPADEQEFTHVSEGNTQFIKISDKASGKKQKKKKKQRQTAKNNKKKKEKKKPKSITFKLIEKIKELF